MGGNKKGHASLKRSAWLWSQRGGSWRPVVLGIVAHLPNLALTQIQLMLFLLVQRSGADSAKNADRFAAFIDRPIAA